MQTGGCQELGVGGMLMGRDFFGGDENVLN